MYILKSVDKSKIQPNSSNEYMISITCHKCCFWDKSNHRQNCYKILEKLNLPQCAWENYWASHCNVSKNITIL